MTKEEYEAFKFDQWLKPLDVDDLFSASVMIFGRVGGALEMLKALKGEPAIINIIETQAKLLVAVMNEHNPGVHKRLADVQLDLMNHKHALSCAQEQVAALEARNKILSEKLEHMTSDAAPSPPPIMMPDDCWVRHHHEKVQEHEEIKRKK